MPIPERLALRRPTEGEVREFCGLCDEIENRVLARQDVSELLARWNTRANRPFAPVEFTTYRDALDTSEFVWTALLPRPHLVPDLTYAELLAVFESVMAASVDGEAEHSYFLSWLDAQFPDSSVPDLIFWPDRWFGEREARMFEFSPDQLLRALMEYSGRMFSDAPVVAIPFTIPKRRVLVTPPPAD